MQCGDNWPTYSGRTFQVTSHAEPSGGVSMKRLACILLMMEGVGYEGEGGDGLVIKVCLKMRQQKKAANAFRSRNWFYELVLCTFDRHKIF